MEVWRFGSSIPAAFWCPLDLHMPNPDVHFHLTVCCCYIGKTERGGMRLVPKQSIGEYLGALLPNSDGQWKNPATIAWEMCGHQRLILLRHDGPCHPDQQKCYLRVRGVWNGLWRKRMTASCGLESSCSCRGYSRGPLKSFRTSPRWG